MNKQAYDCTAINKQADFRVTYNMARKNLTPPKKVHEDLLRAQTDLLQAQQQIQQNSDYLQAVLNHSPAAISFVKAFFDNPNPLQGNPLTDRIIDYRLVTINEKFALLVGEPIGQLAGQSAFRLEQILWQGDTYANFYRIITEDTTYYEERTYDVAGQPRWFSLSATKHNGGVVLTGLDITELRQTQLQRQALLRQVQECDGTVAQLTALRQELSNRRALLRVSCHDMRSSLGVVLGATQLLNLTESNAERVQIMEMINRNVKELTRQLTELLEIAPLEG